MRGHTTAAPLQLTPAALPLSRTRSAADASGDKHRHTRNSSEKYDLPGTPLLTRTSLGNSGGCSGTRLKKETGLSSLRFGANGDVGAGSLLCPANTVGASRETLVTRTGNPSTSTSKNHVEKAICKNDAVQRSIFTQVQVSLPLCNDP